MNAASKYAQCTKKIVTTNVTEWLKTKNFYGERASQSSSKVYHEKEYCAEWSPASLSINGSMVSIIYVHHGVYKYETKRALIKNRIAG